MDTYYYKTKDGEVNGPMHASWVRVQHKNDLFNDVVVAKSANGPWIKPEMIDGLLTAAPHAVAERAPYSPPTHHPAQPIDREGTLGAEGGIAFTVNSLPVFSLIFGILSGLCGLMTIILFFVLFAGAGPSMFKLIAVVNAVLGCAGCAAVSAGLRAVYEIHAKVTEKGL